MRRSFTRRSCWLLLSLLLCAPPTAAAPAPKSPDHVVWVIWGGGVATQDFADKKRMPALAEMARAGRVVERVAVQARDGIRAVARVLTGAEDPGAELATRAPAEPTLCEYVRAARGVSAEDTWYVAFDGSAAKRESCSTHPSFGPAYAPRFAFGAGSVGEPLHRFLAAHGRPVPMQPGAFAQLSRLRALNREIGGNAPRGLHAASPVFARVERALLAELDAKAALVRGPNPGDERAWRAARTVLAVHEPLLTVIRLGESEVADQDASKYRAVLRANDQALRRLRTAIEASPGLKDRTLVVVSTDRPRSPADQGLVAGPGAISVVVWGPGAKRWRPAKGPRQIEDLCVTLGAVLGAPTPHASGRSWLR